VEIYGDQLRSNQMLEDEHTISKAQTADNELSASKVGMLQVRQSNVALGGSERRPSTKIQETIACLLQWPKRIKPDSEKTTSSN